MKKQKEQLDPEHISREAIVDLAEKFNGNVDNNEIIFNQKFAFAYLWRTLNRNAQREILNSLIDYIEIKRDEKYNIDVTKIKFTEQFIHKNAKEYLDYLNMILKDNGKGLTYEGQLEESQVSEIEKNYSIVSILKLYDGTYTNKEKEKYFNMIYTHFYSDGIIERPLVRNNELIDRIIMIPKSFVSNKELKA